MKDIKVDDMPEYETQSIRNILEEAFNKVYEQHGVRLHRVELLDVDVEGRL